jgi:hypothetical protein
MPGGRDKTVLTWEFAQQLARELRMARSEISNLKRHLAHMALRRHEAVWAPSESSTESHEHCRLQNGTLTLDPWSDPFIPWTVIEADGFTLTGSGAETNARITASVAGRYTFGMHCRIMPQVNSDYSITLNVTNPISPDITSVAFIEGSNFHVPLDGTQYHCSCTGQAYLDAGGYITAVNFLGIYELSFVRFWAVRIGA